jgi:predicted Zn-dependent protease
MTTTLRNHLSSQQANPTDLEARTMLAASSIQVKILGNPPQHIKDAVKKAVSFWGKFINTKKQTQIELKLTDLRDPSGVDLFGNPLGPKEIGSLGTVDREKAGKPRKNLLVKLNERRYAQVKGLSGKPKQTREQELIDTTIHEIGHTLGLTHDGADNTIMAATTGKTKRVLSPSLLKELEKNGWRKKGSSAGGKKNNQSKGPKKGPKKLVA